MQSLWNDSEASQYKDDLGLRVYTSRLLGRDKTLVLHGGGNTSVKITEQDIFGNREEVLYIKGSGWDLETIEPAGFTPVRMPHLLKLTELEQLSDPQMVNELVTHTKRAGAPVPSIETILHAILPFKYVDHTHADAVVTITNTPDGEKRIKQIYGDSMVIVPYVMPGFDLAKVCAREFRKQANSKTVGMILMNHGIFSFGNDARESYERMIALVSKAEDYLKQHQAWDIAYGNGSYKKESLRDILAQLRYDVSKAAGKPMIVMSRQSARAINYARRPDIAQISQQGPATPDHIIRTKRIPMLGRNVDTYTKAYEQYFQTNSPHAKEPKSMLDPAPRVILDPELGLCGVGQNAKDANIIVEIYEHTMDVIERATKLGGYRALPERDLFDVEYWDLEQAKLKKGGKPPLFSGEVALITGAASGIGKACVDSLLARGAAVIGLDINKDIEKLYSRTDFLGIRADVTNREEIINALEQGVLQFGGLDMLILNAGIFPSSMPISNVDEIQWHKTMQINLDANLILMRECYSLLKLSPKGGRIVVVGSKNVPAPGPGAAAYSVSKAALTQLARVAALEWGKHGIRVNMIHPNAVFDTGIWSDEILTSRAREYGVSVEEYKKRNVLDVEITSNDVAQMAAEMCGPLFAKTTAAQIPIDGGNERVI